MNNELFDKLYNMSLNDLLHEYSFNKTKYNPEQMKTLDEVIKIKYISKKEIVTYIKRNIKNDVLEYKCENCTELLDLDIDDLTKGFFICPECELKQLVIYPNNFIKNENEKSKFGKVIDKIWDNWYKVKKLVDQTNNSLIVLSTMITLTLLIYLFSDNVDLTGLLSLYGLLTYLVFLPIWVYRTAKENGYPRPRLWVFFTAGSLFGWIFIPAYLYLRRPYYIRHPKVIRKVAL